MKAHFWLMVSLAFVALRAVLLAWVRAGMTEWGYFVHEREGKQFPELWACAALCGAIAAWQAVPWRRLWRRWMGWALIWMAIAVIVFAVAMAIYDHTCAVRRRAAESPAGRMERALETGTYETGIPARWPGRPVADPYAGVAEPSR